MNQSRTSTANLWRTLHGDTSAMEQALAGCPAEVRNAVKTKTPKLRGRADKLLGRHEEFERARQAVLEVARAKENDVTVNATVIAAPPGAGKTALLKTLETQLRKDGVNVIPIMAEHVSSPEEFSRHMRSQPPWGNHESWKRLGRAGLQGLARAADKVISVLTTLGIDQLVSGAREADMGPIQRTIEAWREDRIPNMKDVLITMRSVNDRGTVILMDEAQELAGYRKGSNEYESAKSVLKLLNEPSVRAENDLWNATFVMAGMQDTGEIAEGLTTLTPEIIELNPVGPETVRAMIEHGIDKSTATNDDKASAKSAWVEPLAERYGDWTRHAQCAAEAARIILSAAGAKALSEPWGIPLLLDTADGYRTKLYRDTIRRAKKHDISSLMIESVMAALASGPSLQRTELEIRRVINQCSTIEAEADDETLTPEARKTKRIDTIRNMRRAGLINVDKETGRFHSPIPSMIRYVATHLEEAPDIVNQALADAKLTMSRDNSSGPLNPWAAVLPEIDELD